jgi:hypothetical protein
MLPGDRFVLLPVPMPDANGDPTRPSGDVTLPLLPPAPSGIASRASHNPTLGEAPGLVPMLPLLPCGRTALPVLTVSLLAAF